MRAVDVVPLGLPGAGKGTAAKLAARELGLPHVSTGDMLRALDRDSELGKQVFALIDAGDFVPDELIAAVVSERLSQDDASRGVVLDGFPRTLPQLPMYDELADTLSRRSLFVQLALPEEVAKARLVGRGEGRPDDAPEVVERRIEVYHELTDPLLSRLEIDNRLHRVDATLPPEQVAAFLVHLRRSHEHVLERPQAAPALEL